MHLKFLDTITAKIINLFPLKLFFRILNRHQVRWGSMTVIMWNKWLILYPISSIITQINHLRMNQTISNEVVLFSEIVLFIFFPRCFQESYTHLLIFVSILIQFTRIKLSYYTISTLSWRGSPLIIFLQKHKMLLRTPTFIWSKTKFGFGKTQSIFFFYW